MIVLNENQNFSFDFLRNRKIEEICNEDYEEKLKKSHNYFKEKVWNSQELDFADEMLLKNFSNKYLEYLVFY